MSSVRKSRKVAVEVCLQRVLPTGVSQLVWSYCAGERGGEFRGQAVFQKRVCPSILPDSISHLASISPEGLLFSEHKSGPDTYFENVVWRGEWFSFKLDPLPGQTPPPPPEGPGSEALSWRPRWSLSACSADASFVGERSIRPRGRLQIWRDGEPFCVVPAGFIMTVRYSPCAETLMVVMEYKRVCLYDVYTGKQTAQVAVPTTGVIQTVEVCENRLYAVAGAGELTVQDVATGDLLAMYKLKRTLPPNSCRAAWLTVMPDHTVLLWSDMYLPYNPESVEGRWSLFCHRIVLSRTTSLKRGYCYRLYLENLPLHVPGYVSDAEHRNCLTDVFLHPQKPNCVLILDGDSRWSTDLHSLCITHVE
jgi:hypothetical protein